MENNIGIYVHIPFCKQKCKYCDFVSFSDKGKRIDEYFNCLIMEIEEKAKEYGKQYNEVDTIYIGGGTPSLVDEFFIEKILSKIREKFKVQKNAEITIEANPGTVNKDKLKKYYEMGINRISIGLQSADDRILKMLGRIHTYDEFNNTFNNARDIGFKNINVDLMIGLPKQSVENVDISLAKIVEKNPEHISVYSLIVEENTPMFDLIESGDLELPSEEVERDMYWNVKNKLQEAGYVHYEISNFAKPTYESKHNNNCWKQASYLGFGVAAHSYFDGIRFSNIDNLEQYISNYKNDNSIYNVVFHEKQDKQDMMKEYMLLGLRKIDGVNITEFKNKFSENLVYVFRNEISELVDKELIEVDDNYVKLTDKGIDLANVVWRAFV